MRPIPSQEQLAKLPKWAQTYIEVLSSEAHRAQRDLEEHRHSQKRTRIIWNGSHALDGNPVYLNDGPYSTVSFDTTRDEVAVRLDAEDKAHRDLIEITRGSTFFMNGRRGDNDTTITLRGSDGRLAVEPKAGNEIVVRYIDRYTDAGY
jgi:hypothetical protein